MNPTRPKVAPFKSIADELDADVLTLRTSDIDKPVNFPSDFVFGLLDVDGITATASPTTSPLQIFDYSFEVAFFTCTHLVEIA